MSDVPELSLSAERLRIGVRSVPAARIRLERVIVTEERTVTVTLRHEELRIHRDDLLDPDAVGDDLIGTDLIGTDRVRTPARPEPPLPFSIVLSAERPVFSVETVPVERITVDRTVVTELREVTEAVRREQAALDVLDAPGPIAPEPH